ncbi:unnamed protein product [Symbiodinium sp. CCMP2592]|nr:unnamed protein product [Symbiodinium sp. CCMP2592]
MDLLQDRETYSPAGSRHLAACVHEWHPGEGVERRSTIEDTMRNPPEKLEMAQLPQGTAFKFKPSVGSWLHNRPSQVAPPRLHTVCGDCGEMEDHAKVPDTVPWPLASLEDICSKQPDQAAKEAQGEQEQEEHWNTAEPEASWWDALGLFVCCFGRGYA